MSGSDPVAALRARQGWDDEAMLALAEEYIKRQNDDPTYLAFLHQQADLENDLYDDDTEDDDFEDDEDDPHRPFSGLLRLDDIIPLPPPPA